MEGVVGKADEGTAGGDTLGMKDDISLDEFRDMLVHAKVKAMVYISNMVNVVRCRDCKECY